MSNIEELEELPKVSVPFCVESKLYTEENNKGIKAILVNRLESKIRFKYDMVYSHVIQLESGVIVAVMHVRPDNVDMNTVSIILTDIDNYRLDTVYEFSKQPDLNQLTLYIKYGWLIIDDNTNKITAIALDNYKNIKELEKSA